MMDNSAAHGEAARDEAARGEAAGGETTYFDNLASRWWDRRGPFAALQRMTPARVDYITMSARRIMGADSIAGLTVLDIGCGGGLLAEPLARLGAIVTGIDASHEAIRAASHHAGISGLDIDYHAASLEDFAAANAKTHDIVIASEVIEHVPRRDAFLTAMAGFGKKDNASMAIFTTINRSFAGLAFGKYAAEYLLGLAPKGAHDPALLVRPDELRREALAAGIRIDDITGIRPSLFEGFKLGGGAWINYAASGLILAQD